MPKNSEPSHAYHPGHSYIKKPSKTRTVVSVEVESVRNVKSFIQPSNNAPGPKQDILSFLDDDSDLSDAPPENENSTSLTDDDSELSDAPPEKVDSENEGDEHYFGGESSEVKKTPKLAPHLRMVLNKGNSRFGHNWTAEQCVWVIRQGPMKYKKLSELMKAEAIARGDPSWVRTERALRDFIWKKGGHEGLARLYSGWVSPKKQGGSTNAADRHAMASRRPAPKSLMKSPTAVSPFGLLERELADTLFPTPRPHRNFPQNAFIPLERQLIRQWHSTAVRAGRWTVIAAYLTNLAQTDHRFISRSAAEVELLLREAMQEDGWWGKHGNSFEKSNRMKSAIIRGWEKLDMDEVDEGL